MSQILPTGDGNKTVYMRWKDCLGNTTSDFTRNITLDTTAPTITITQPNTNPATSKTITAT